MGEYYMIQTCTKNSGKIEAILSYSKQDVGIMFALFQSINALSLPLWPGLQKHGLGPQNSLCKEKQNLRLVTHTVHSSFKTHVV